MAHKNTRNEALAAAIAAAADAPPPKVGAPDITRVSARANTVHQGAVIAEAMMIANAHIQEIIEDAESRAELTGALEDRFTEVMINRSPTMDRGALRMLLADTDKRAMNAQRKPEESFHYLVDHCLRQAVVSLAQQPNHSWMSEVADAPREADWERHLTSTAQYLKNIRHVPVKPPSGRSEEDDEGKSTFIPAKPFNSAAVNGGGTSSHESGFDAKPSSPMLSRDGAPKVTAVNIPEAAPDETVGLDAGPEEVEETIAPPAVSAAEIPENPSKKVHERATCTPRQGTPREPKAFDSTRKSLLEWLERHGTASEVLHHPRTLRATTPQQLQGTLISVRNAVGPSREGKALLAAFINAHAQEWGIANPLPAGTKGGSSGAETGALWGNGGNVVRGNQPPGRFD
ncbi:MAG: hypothetical protein K2X09_00710 [Rickettsiales bacterium]|nr:hypothetical protein [Rickettsiales bacterium]